MPGHQGGPAVGDYSSKCRFGQWAMEKRREGEKRLYSPGEQSWFGTGGGKTTIRGVSSLWPEVQGHPELLHVWGTKRDPLHKRNRYGSPSQGMGKEGLGEDVGWGKPAEGISTLPFSGALRELAFGLQLSCGMSLSHLSVCL